MRDVVNHVVGQNFRHARLLHGGSLEEYSRVREDDWIGDDAVASWERGNHEYDAAYAEPGALERIVEYWGGPTTGRQLLRARVFELTVHTWDLACGIGADDRLDENLVGAMLRGVSAPLSSGASGPFATPVGELPVGASPQERLLYFCGRRSGS